MARMKFHLLFLLSGMICMFFQPGYGGAQEQQVRLDDLIQETLQNNPQLKAAKYRTDAARTEIRRVTAWEPPQIGMELFQTPIDPVMQAITGEKGKDKQAASAITIGRFETDLLTQRDNLKNLSDIIDRWIKKGMVKTPHQ